MPLNDDLSPRQYDTELLNPWVKDRFVLLAIEIQEVGLPFLIFETWRSPDRQQLLLEQGTTKAKPWFSPHQWGMAVDFVPFIDGRWVWEGDQPWERLSRMAIRYELSCPITWDPGHVQAPEWKKLPL